ncbi:3-oxoacyl-[acyl-carrier-protein] synthase III C-terminal domain-containing protein [Pseudomonas sp. RIT-PI-S]|uniref:3-oxoacyl-[acyl-carrier-protein] synthase III C-terminal domain-containing protein n=1 Tax=Pseudomonas sp. RIT-PI-S TaxID=3035295 RepID=UPI0021DB4444|nr:3-oxoacyl-[acyl-carrier-protein] synthase III C-terminal domain-containing protein [Pseudomonas sp. RIT-PI-S]
MHNSPSFFRPVSILGTGHALPQRMLTSAELDATLHLAAGTVERISGVRHRPLAGPDDTAASLGAAAARNALDAAGVTLRQIDLVVCASGTQDQGMPCNAALLHRELGLGGSGVPAMDINASCLSFIAALDTLSWPLAAGRYQRVLLVCSDIASCGLDWQQVGVSGIFGDGAAAVVLAPGERRGAGIIASSLKTYSEGAGYCEIRAGGSRYHPSRISEPFAPLTRFAMHGKPVFRLTAQYLPGLVDSVLAQAGMTLAEVDWIVPHQASRQSLDHAFKRLGFDVNKVVDIFAGHGNQIAASLPTALDIAIRDQRIRRGHRVLLVGTGAGLSLGGMILEY